MARARPLTVSISLLLSLFCILNTADCASWRTNGGYIHLLWQHHQSSAIAPLNVMTLRKKRARGGSRLVVMNVSQSVWSLYLTSQSAQFLLCRVLRQRYVRTAPSRSVVTVGFFCEGLDGWHKCPLVMPWGLRPRVLKGLILIHAGTILDFYDWSEPVKMKVSDVCSDSKNGTFWQGWERKQIQTHQAKRHQGNTKKLVWTGACLLSIKTLAARANFKGALLQLYMSKCFVFFYKGSTVPFQVWKNYSNYASSGLETKNLQKKATCDGLEV